ncbi:cryptochrome/photolyase family protein [Knoellia subterranea]|uniref:Deoxyribodipyrimidine photo-lyase n=1 Tax=Knoellia subterranea KCTC 19937 TaxID=1385521 RepID=A0A0A0JI95_9MICO|nr:deoxyribodipyrimidine photo-lyase [Knoellia subterranea]KGN37100.1 deoxyribodipyrimidine photo-lyase [Knoellia subterranea KCTC 19937]
MTSILWLRRDLRRADHPALLAARDAADGDLVVAYVLDPALWSSAGPVRRAWLAATLEATARDYGDALTLLWGNSRIVVPELAKRLGATSVHVTRETTPFGRRRDEDIANSLAAQGVSWLETGTPYAVGPGLVVNGTGTPYKVFTPFARAWREHGWPDPAPRPRDLPLRHARNDADATRALRDALTQPDLPTLPDAGEEAAHARWREFLETGVTAYATDRDLPGRDGTSRLSPHLKLGTIHPRTLLADLASRRGTGKETFVDELAWREFYADVLWHNPSSAWTDLRDALAGMEYDEPADAIEAWRAGTTGYPIVDAGMRQLLATGWMHNRVRMITASFLTKDLHVWWPVGARHFLDHLVDGDIASNSHGWQWVAGTGTDASPYFRVFNPVTQGEKFDPDGDYVREWVPELAHLAGKAAHQPWEHADGYARGYPARIVDHAEERREALRRLDAVKRGTAAR